jgi:hypothetical protein
LRRSVKAGCADAESVDEKMKSSHGTVGRAGGSRKEWGEFSAKVIGG